MEKKCPIRRLRLYLEMRNLWDAKQEDELAQSIAKEINEAIAAAKETARPPLKSLVENVYFNIPPPLQEEYEELKTFFPKG